MSLSRDTRSNNAIWIVMYWLTKLTHFIPFKLGQSSKVLARIFIQEVVRLHKIPIRIISGRDTRFRL